LSRNNLKKVVHGGKVKRVREEGHSGILDFSANLNPKPPKLSINFDEQSLGYYPDDSYYALKSEIGRLFHRKPEEITVGNGSVEIIRVFCASVLSEGDLAYIHQPTFGEYEFSVILAGGGNTEKEGDARVSFLCNPNNPTGEILSKEFLQVYLQECEQNDRILFLDEAFIELSDPAQSMVENCDPSLFVMRSLTKSFSVPGIRFGYGFGDPELIESMEAVRPPWTVNSFAEQIAFEAFRHYADLEASRAYIRKEREWLCDELSGYCTRIYPSSVNFLLLDLGRDVTDICSRFEREDILVRDCHSFGLPTCIRVAVKTHDENKRLVEAFPLCVR
jgi:threonine-phosphate decarboxylase